MESAPQSMRSTRSAVLLTGPGLAQPRPACGIALAAPGVGLGVGAGLAARLGTRTVEVIVRVGVDPSVRREAIDVEGLGGVSFGHDDPSYLCWEGTPYII